MKMDMTYVIIFADALSMRSRRLQLEHDRLRLADRAPQGKARFTRGGRRDSLAQRERGEVGPDRIGIEMVVRAAFPSRPVGSPWTSLPFLSFAVYARGIRVVLPRK